MAIKAHFSSGVKTLTVSGLYQWDYGQQLEIEADSLPALLEVHFACAGMESAIVRSCNSVDNIVTVTIPNACLEQSNAITAWVYEIGETSGKTIFVVTMPVTARIRPALSPSIPEDFTDKYTEAVSAINNAVDDVLAEITSAKNQAITDVGTSKNGAVSAIESTKTAAMNEVEALVPFSAPASATALPSAGFYYIEARNAPSRIAFGLVYWDGFNAKDMTSFSYNSTGGAAHYCLAVLSDGTFRLRYYADGADTPIDVTADWYFNISKISS